MARKYHQGRFKPLNPSKYKGDPTKIIYRSGWENKAFTYFDRHPDVIWWQSEETIIPYISPIDGKYHRYFMDLKVCFKDREGKIKIFLIEIKPFSQTRPPVLQENKKPSKSYINEVMTWGVNQAKWEAAKKLCKQKGWQFLIMTEYELGIKQRK